jgi:undecaprenyl-phosphate 4-deoxy-4-formamido-L-arabinose transferase
VADQSSAGSQAPPPYLSVVIPVFNEAENLRPLFDRLTKVLDELGTSWEIVFTDDGSKDESVPLLLELQRHRPSQIQVVEFSRNFGQHMAVLAALRQSRGEVVITLDADMQDPPEEIPKLVEAIHQGHDVAGGYRVERQDSSFRKTASRIVNALRSRATSLHMRDQGCMLRAYKREIVDLILQSNESITFVPALAALYAGNPVDVPVQHAPRVGGRSKYNLYRLVRLNFDLVTGFSAAPLQVFSLVGLLVSALSGALVLLLAIRRLVVGPEVEGVFTLIGILFFFQGICITGIGIMGEYVARIYQEVRRRPPYVIKKIHGPRPE